MMQNKTILTVLLIAVLLQPGRALADGEYESVCASQRLMQETFLKNKLAFMSLAECYLANEIALCKKHIADEYKIAKISGGGIINKSKIYDYQQCVRRDLEMIGEFKAKILALGLKPASCMSGQMKTIMQCVRSNLKRPECTIEPVSTLSQIVSVYFDSLLDRGAPFASCGDDPIPFTE